MTELRGRIDLVADSAVDTFASELESLDRELQYIKELHRRYNIAHSDQLRSRVRRSLETMVRFGMEAQQDLAVLSSLDIVKRGVRPEEENE